VYIQGSFVCIGLFYVYIGIFSVYIGIFSGVERSFYMYARPFCVHAWLCVCMQTFLCRYEALLFV